MCEWALYWPIGMCMWGGTVHGYIYMYPNIGNNLRTPFFPFQNFPTKKQSHLLVMNKFVTGDIHLIQFQMLWPIGLPSSNKEEDNPLDGSSSLGCRHKVFCGYCAYEQFS
jgi:hypothetical protein